MGSSRSLSRQNLDALTVEVLRPAAGARPEVRVVALDGGQAVVKDFAAASNPFKRLLGSYLILREFAAYRHLSGVPGVPRCLGRLDRYALMTEHVDATGALGGVTEEELPQFIAKLTRLCARVHERGVAHGDMRKLDNILVDRHGEPVLVDFTAAFVAGSNPLGALIFPALAEDDLRGVVKLKAAIAPGSLTRAEQTRLAYRPPVERFFRLWREHVRQAVKRWSGEFGARK
jgi:hypothetical protein